MIENSEHWQALIRFTQRDKKPRHDKLRFAAGAITSGVIMLGSLFLIMMKGKSK